MHLDTNFNTKKMRTTIFLIAVILLSIIGCNKNNDANNATINGNYTGFFERSGNISNVELKFNNNGTWSGESATVKFPALCNGTFSISGNSISFENACIWTTEFDGTLILSSEWNYSFNKNSLILTKNNGDKYTLTKQ